MMRIKCYKISSVDRDANHTVSDRGKQASWSRSLISVPGRCQLACRYIGELGSTGALSAIGLSCVVRQSFIAPR